MHKIDNCALRSQAAKVTLAVFDTDGIMTNFSPDGRDDKPEAQKKLSSAYERFL